MHAKEEKTHEQKIKEIQVNASVLSFIFQQYFDICWQESEENGSEKGGGETISWCFVVGMENSKSFLADGNHNIRRNDNISTKDSGT